MSTLESKSVLVVGGCGFLGSHIVAQLVDKYHASVSVLDLRTTRNRHAGATYYDGDITSIEQTRTIFEKCKPEVLFNTVSPVLVEHNKPLIQKVNVEGTKILLEVAGQTSSMKAFVFTSSAGVVSDNDTMEVTNATEEWPLVRGKMQHEYYADTKAEGEQLVLAANRKYNSMLTVAIRPSGIFGERDVQLVPRMMEAYRNGLTRVQLGNNDNLFDYSYVGNVAHGHILAAIALLSTHELPTEPLDYERVDGEAFNITNGTPVYFWDFARYLWRMQGDTSEGPAFILNRDLGLLIGTLLTWICWVFGKKPRLGPQQVKFSTMTRYYSIDKARKRLGYQPIVGLEEGLRRAAEDWLREEREALEKKAQ